MPMVVVVGKARELVPQLPIQSAEVAEGDVAAVIAGKVRDRVLDLPVHVLEAVQDRVVEFLAVLPLLPDCVAKFGGQRRLVIAEVLPPLAGERLDLAHDAADHLVARRPLLRSARVQLVL